MNNKYLPNLLGLFSEFHHRLLLYFDDDESKRGTKKKERKTERKKERKKTVSRDGIHLARIGTSSGLL
jgi:hypothetical protein